MNMIFATVNLAPIYDPIAENASLMLDVAGGVAVGALACGLFYFGGLGLWRFFKSLK